MAATAQNNNSRCFVDEETSAALSAVEKAKAALWFEIAGLIISVAGIIMNPGTFMLYFQSSFLSTPFYFGIPIAVWMGAFLRKDALQSDWD